MIICQCGHEMEDVGIEYQIRVKGQYRECYECKKYLCRNDNCLHYIYIVKRILPPEECKHIEVDFNEEIVL